MDAPNHNGGSRLSDRTLSVRVVILPTGSPVLEKVQEVARSAHHRFLTADIALEQHRSDLSSRP